MYYLPSINYERMWVTRCHRIQYSVFSPQPFMHPLFLPGTHWPLLFSSMDGGLCTCHCDTDSYFTLHYITSFSRGSHPERLTVSTTIPLRRGCSAVAKDTRAQPGIEPATFWLIARFPNRSAICPPQTFFLCWIEFLQPRVFRLKVAVTCGNSSLNIHFRDISGIDHFWNHSEQPTHRNITLFAWF